RKNTHHIRGHPRNALLRYLNSAKNIAAAGHHSHVDAERVRSNDIAGDPIQRRLVNAEAFRAHKGFTRNLDDQTAIFQLSHGADFHPCRPARAPAAADQLRPAVAATSVAKSVSGRSMPSPRA